MHATSISWWFCLAIGDDVVGANEWKSITWGWTMMTLHAAVLLYSRIFLCMYYRLELSLHTLLQISYLLRYVLYFIYLVGESNVGFYCWKNFSACMLLPSSWCCPCLVGSDSLNFSTCILLLPFSRWPVMMLLVLMSGSLCHDGCRSSHSWFWKPPCSCAHRFLSPSPFHIPPRSYNIPGSLHS